MSVHGLFQYKYWVLSNEVSRWQIRNEQEAGECVLGGSFSPTCALTWLCAVFLGCKQLMVYNAVPLS